MGEVWWMSEWVVMEKFEENIGDKETETKKLS